MVFDGDGDGFSSRGGAEARENHPQVCIDPIRADAHDAGYLLGKIKGHTLRKSEIN